jgi:endonuclease III-like uncharacterized protein
MRDTQHVERVMRTLGRAITGMDLPAVEKISESQSEDPFQILIATLLSARTQDATTHAASTRLFKRARTPRTMARLDVKEIETLIYPVSFYRNKARHVKACCKMLVDRYRGRVPERSEYLRGHTRASHLESSRLGEDTRAGRDRAGAVSIDGVAVVAIAQSVSRHVGTERVPAGLSTVRGLRHRT